jgi:hypothetical protein
MMTNTSGLYTKTGDAIRADGWWGNTDGLHTVQVKYINFKGFFKLEGTLSMTPTDSDWFPIYLNNGNSISPCVEFDYETGNIAFTFVGNFVHLRAKMIREEVFPEPDYSVILTLGAIDKVLLAL